jgi:hypothetical protein
LFHYMVKLDGCIAIAVQRYEIKRPKQCGDGRFFPTWPGRKKSGKKQRNALYMGVSVQVGKGRKRSEKTFSTRGVY